MKCPVCRANYRSSGSRSSCSHSSSDPLNCHRCGVDLSPLIHLYDQTIWYYRQAIQALQAGDYDAAIAWNNQALALNHNNADFHVLAGQIWALQGEFQGAIGAWEKAQQLNPQHPKVQTYLQELEMIIECQKAPKSSSGRDLR